MKAACFGDYKSFQIQSKQKKTLPICCVSPGICVRIIHKCYHYQMMNNAIRYILFYFIFLGFISFFIYPLLVVLMTVWSSITLLCIKRRSFVELATSDQKLFLTTALIYPLIAALLKLLIIRDLIPHSFYFLNTIEHCLWAFSFTIILTTFFVNIKKKLLPIEHTMLLITVVSTIGIVNEVFEYSIRIIIHLTDQSLFAAYYPDTIKDLCVNIIGSSIGAILMLGFTSHNRKKTVREN